MIDNTEAIMKLIAAEYRVTVTQIKGRSRKRPLPEARQMLCVLLKKNGSKATAKVLRWNRSTVSYSIRKIKALMSVYKDVSDRYHRLSAKIAKL